LKAKSKLEPEDAIKRTENVFGYALLGIALVVFFTQLRSLFYFPVFDSYLWWGDESWLMLEFREQMAHGLLRHPLALGSTLNASNGLLLSNMWITAILYGLPQLVFAHVHDPIFIGRIVTGLLDVALISSTFYILRKRRVSSILTSLSIVLLITSRTFLLTSHSARYDILTALSLLWIFHMLIAKIDSFKSEEGISPFTAYLLGFAFPITALVSAHLLLLTAALFLYAAIKLGVFRRFSTIALFVLGGATVGFAFVAVYWILTGSLVLFNSTNGQGFQLTLREMPILRPFSRSVQIANLVQRWRQVTFFAPFVLASGVIVFTAWLSGRLRQRTSARKSRLLTMTIVLLLLLFSWLFFESSAPTSYLIYIVPIAILASACVMQRMLNSVVVQNNLRVPALFLTFILGVAVSVLGYREVSNAATKSLAWSSANADACAQMYSAIVKDANAKGIYSPLVVIFNPAIDRFQEFDDVREMTTHFIEYPATSDAPDSVLRKFRVSYILMYRSALRPLYMREVQPLEEIVAKRGTLIAKAHGEFTDIGRSYFEDDLRHADDTLVVYRLK
jgi:hypothetical protein